MNIEITFKTTNPRERIDYIEFEGITLTWDTTTYSHGVTYGKGVYFNDTYANGKLAELEGKKVTAIGVYNEDTQTESNTCNIVSITVSDGDNSMSVYSRLFADFQYRSISIKGREILLTESEYFEFAEYVRNEDAKETLINAIENYGWNEEFPNVCDYITNIETATSFIDEVTEYTGEDEHHAFLNILKNNGLIHSYLLTSNKDTFDEATNEVLLLKKQADEIAFEIASAEKELNRSTKMIIDINGDSVALKYVNEITVLGEYDF